MTPEADEVGEWLRKGRNDLLSAQVLLEHDPPITDTAAFHCQQAVEKALKAYLIWKNVPFEKVHSLGYLMDLCEQQDKSFAAFRDRVEALAPFAVGIRYPGELMDVPPDEAKELLATTEAVWELVIRLLPQDLN